ncbi:ribosomal protein S12 methylthiotransferase accessory factor [Bacteroidales bacterium WCE2008]|nr:ribosomal protein S12 methylthiotransferase accessory factor [Bacteroidales bacterium WCE2008]
MRKFKQYKAVSPEETINRIRVILDNVGIFLKENSSEKDGLYACRLTINNDGLSAMDIGTNGKGRTYEYALASGYAEFMERLQNGLVYDQTALNRMVKSIVETHDDSSPMKRQLIDYGYDCNFVSDINESLWSADAAINTYHDDLQQLFRIKDDKAVYAQIKKYIDEEQALMVPVYSVTKGKEVLYPIKWALMATGSNGMCAGNTPSEAILQGMCEIFERYSAYHIFFDHLTPPTLDIELFKDTIVYGKMRALMNRYGYEFIIKDCSLGKGLPVIGLLIIDRKHKTYNFKLGADFVPAIALERCLTEVYQSHSGFICLPLLSGTIDNNDVNYLRMLRSGTGQWPESIFYSTPSYQFAGFDDSLGKDNDSDLRYGFKLIGDLGSNLYIRDNSFLGFPTYYVIAPGLSGVYQSIAELNENKQTSPDYIMSKYKGKFNFERDMKSFTLEVEAALKKTGEFIFNELIPFYQSKELSDLDPNLFLCMAYYKMGNYQKAYDYIHSFLRGKDNDYEYYFAASDYILLRYLNNVKDDDVKSTLTIKYGREIAEDVIEDMHSPEDIFKYYSFDRHFDWRNMNTNRSSFFMRVLALDRRIKKAIVENSVKQSDLGKLF